MGVSHIALAVKDIHATHEFYTASMGFELCKVEVAPKDGGFARHVFYDTGSGDTQLIAFWDYSNVPGYEDMTTDISRGLGLEPFTNHLAFTADSVEDLHAKRTRLLDNGHTVVEIDHGWVHSIYVEDPDGITVEFAVITRELTAQDAANAAELLAAEMPEPTPDVPVVTMHAPDGTATPIPVDR